MSDSNSVLPVEHGTLKLDKVRASSEARRRRILANAEARLQAITGGVKPPRVRPSEVFETATDFPHQSLHENDFDPSRTSPILTEAKPPVNLDQTPEVESALYKNRVDFLTMLCLGLCTRVCFAAYDLQFNLFVPFVIFALPLLLLSATLTSPSVDTPGLQSIIIHALLSNGRPLLRRLSICWAIFRTVLEYLAAYLFSFIFAHIFLAELNIS